MRGRLDLTYSWVALPVLAADRLSKAAVCRTIKTVGARSLLPGLLSLKYCENTGVAFSMLSNARGLTTALNALLVAALMAWLLLDTKLARSARCCLWAAAGGGLGNLVDRLLYGYVVDFIQFDFMHFAIFNAADIFVCLGALGAIVFLLLSEGGPGHGRE